MALHLIAYAQTISAAPAAQQALDPVPDATVTVNGKLIYVPDKYNQVIFAGSLVSAGVATQSSLRAPSLREMFYPDLTPLVVGGNFPGPHPAYNIAANPLQLVSNEGLEFYTDGNNAATPTNCFGVVCLGDAKPATASGKIYTMRATGAAGLTMGAWKNTPIVFNQTLPVGNYDIVGMRAVGVGLVAARLVFIGSSAVTRPGVLAAASQQTVDIVNQRNGNLGVLGTFNSITPPSVECIGLTGTAQTFEFDLVAR